MKVQRKNGTPTRQYEVVEETCKFYVVYGDILGSYTAYSKADYEPVQEWVDVTHECFLEFTYGDRGYLLVHNRPGCSSTGVDPNKGYRVTLKGIAQYKVERKKA